MIGNPFAQCFPCACILQFLAGLFAEINDVRVMIAFDQ